DFQINYYSDGGCSNYTTQFNPSTDGSCYDYQADNVNSGNIVGCPTGGDCQCTFYEQKGCQGKHQQVMGVRWDAQDCASNWGPGWASVSCNT
ncbi:hypothetical protein BGZ63DRAFT_317520, partial [Mariannaea sp. PMI_226]